jgi:hypothetical protein
MATLERRHVKLEGEGVLSFDYLAKSAVVQLLE